jgi:hypothetical protein
MLCSFAYLMYVFVKANARNNPIYLFYEEVSLNANNLTGELGDKHFKCCHGSRKTLTISAAKKVLDPAMAADYLVTLCIYLTSHPPLHWMCCDV